MSTADDPWSLLSLAEQALAAEDYNRHKTLAEKALLLANGGADWPLLAHAYCHRALAHSRWNEMEQAMLCYRSALAGFDQPLLDTTRTPAQEPWLNYPHGWALEQQNQNLLGQSTLAFMQGTQALRRKEFPTAVQQLTLSHDGFARLGDQQNQARALHQLAVAAHWQGDYARADACFRQSLSLAAAVGAAAQYSAVQVDWGTLCEDQGRYPEAETLYRQRLAQVTANGDQRSQGYVLYKLGTLAQAQGRYAEAEQWYSQCWPLLVATDNRNVQGAVWNQCGKIYLDQGDYAEAERHFNESLAIFRALNEAVSQAEAMFNRGVLEHNRGAVEQAGYWYRQSLAIAESHGDRLLAARNLACLGGVQQAQGDNAQAQHSYERSYTLWQQLGFPDSERAFLLPIYNGLGVLAIQRNDYAEGERLLRYGVQLAEETGNAHETAVGLRWLGLACAQQGQHAAAFSCWMRAYRLFEQLQSPAAAEISEMLGVLRQMIGADAYARLRE